MEEGTPGICAKCGKKINRYSKTPYCKECRSVTCKKCGKRYDPTIRKTRGFSCPHCKLGSGAGTLKDPYNRVRIEDNSIYG